ncbi:MAG: PHP domain-containing protein [Promethearchaeota archaeon]
MIIRSDLHSHTIYSDGSVTLEELVRNAIRHNFKLITKADHNTTRGNKKLKKLAESKGLIFLPGVEISAKGGHLLAYNIDFWDPNWGGKPIQEEIEFVLEKGGVPVVAHPYWRGGLGKGIFKLKGLVGYEILNHSSPFGSIKLLKGAKKEPELYNSLGKYAGSDSHSGVAYGHYYTQIKVDDLSKEEIVESMLKMRVSCYGPIMPLLLVVRDAHKNLVYHEKLKFIKKKSRKR